MPGSTLSETVDARLIGACGFYCGSCPSYTGGSCSGCRDSQKPGDCYTLDCVTKRGLVYCGQCAAFPCSELLTNEKATLLNRQWLLWKRRQRETE